MLKLDGDVGFDALVKRYSGDMTPNAMLEELTRLQVVEMTARRAVRLKTRAYIPQTSVLDILQILGTDTADLIETIHYNIRNNESELEKLDSWLAKRYTEKQSLGTPGSRLGLGIYVVEAENQRSTSPLVPNNSVSRSDNNDD